MKTTGIWHPCTHMKDHELFPPHHIIKAAGSKLYLKDGSTLIDATSSWWCKSLGHNHPALKSALYKQVEQFEHTIFSDTTHDSITLLTEKLLAFRPDFSQVFYTGDGTSAVEVALKMSLHLRYIKSQKRQHIISLSNSYHGESLLTLSVSDVQLYTKPYKHMMKNHTYTVDNLPYVSSKHASKWSNCSDEWNNIERQLAPYRNSASAIIVEPLLQGAGGMKIYSAKLLTHLRQWCDRHDVHLIADEILTGIGRTGKMLACDHADITPDITCLSKGLTSGWLAFSAILTTNKIFEPFYHERHRQNTFLHSNTYCGNPMGAAIANACIDYIQEENICDRVTQIEKVLMSNMQALAKSTNLLSNIRGLGAMVAADFHTLSPTTVKKITYHAAKYGVLLRPLGCTLYWLPPLNISPHTLEELKMGTLRAITDYIEGKIID